MRCLRSSNRQRSVCDMHITGTACIMTAADYRGPSMHMAHDSCRIEQTKIGFQNTPPRHPPAQGSTPPRVRMAGLQHVGIN